MLSPERATVGRSFDYLERAIGDRSLDYQVVVLGTPDLPLNFYHAGYWKPIKDLERAILLSEPGKIDVAPGQVKFVGGYGTRSVAYCPIKSKEGALKIMDRLAGNTWFGALLEALVFETHGKRPPQVIGWRNKSSWPQPLPLDEVHPTKDLVSISPVTYTSSMSSPPLGTGFQQSNNGTVGAPNAFPMPGVGPMANPHYAALTPAMISPTGFVFFDSPYPPNWFQLLQEQAQGILGLLPLGWPYQSYSTPIQTPQDPRLIPSSYHFSHFVSQPPQQLTVPTYYAPRTVSHGMDLDPPKYHANPNGLFVNITHGSIPVEPHGIHVRNLNHAATLEDVESYFRQAGEIEQCEVKRNRNTKQTTAVVSFRTSRQAQIAVVRFHGTNFMGRKISVKADNDTVGPDATRGTTNPMESTQPPPKSLSRQGPIIVNGSGEDLSNGAAHSSPSRDLAGEDRKGNTNGNRIAFGCETITDDRAENEDVKGLAGKTRKMKISK